MASAQLQLIHSDHTWKLDRRTVQIGRAGIAQARAALAAATKTEAEIAAEVMDSENVGHQVAA
jgi:hypothetical protein